MAASAGGAACSACSLARRMLLISMGAMSDLAASNEMGMMPSVSGSCAAHDKKSAIHMSYPLWYLTTKEYFCKISRSLAMRSVHGSSLAFMMYMIAEWSTYTSKYMCDNK